MNNNINKLKKYETTIILTEEFNDNELKTWVFNFAKSLKKFNICDISVISRGKHKFSYPIKNSFKGNYIQLNISSSPKYIDIIKARLILNPNVLRFLILNKSN